MINIKTMARVLIIALFLICFGLILLIGCDTMDMLIEQTKQANRGSLFAARFSSPSLFDNPYDPDEVAMDAYITTPDGRVEVIPCFWAVDYTRELIDGVEHLTKTDDGHWELRYTPRVTGEYKYYVKWEAQSNRSFRSPENGAYTFEATAADSKGFLTVSNEDQNYLAFDDGSFFLGIGHNLCGWEFHGTENKAGTYDYDVWLSRIAENGGNMSQFDFCEGDQIEWTYNAAELPYSADWNGLNSYNQQTAWKMDERFRIAENLGVYFRLAMFHWEDFDKEIENFPHWGWLRNPYNSVNGGLVNNVHEFFADEASMNIVKKSLRYSVARWGYSPNILAFEIWNEVDAPDMVWGTGHSYTDTAASISEWHKEMASYISSLDINRHIVTTSFADSNNGNRIWSLQEIAISTIHRYTMYNPAGSLYETVKTISGLVNKRFTATGKPVLIGEFALSPAGEIQRRDDKDGFAMHQQLWASVLSKSVGTAMHWTWGSYIDANDLYHLYKPLADFTAGEDFRGGKAFILQGKGQPITLGIRNGADVFLWVSDPGHAFEDARDGVTPRTVENIEVIIKDLPIAQYEVSFHDTFVGGLVGQEMAQSDESGLVVRLPAFKADIAVKIKKAN